jgi:hypothetical protein
VPAAVPDDPTFRAFASSWLEDNMLEWRQSTVMDIRWRLESHLLPHIGEERLPAFDIPGVTAVKTTLLKESRRIAERLNADVIERDGHNMPLRPLSNASINKVMALLGRILDDASSAATYATTRRGAFGACVTARSVARSSSRTRCVPCSRPPIVWTVAGPG